MLGSDKERIVAFEHRFARAQATDVAELPWGFAVLQRDFPFSHWHNRIVVTSAVPALHVVATAEEVLGGANLRHRYVSVDEPLAETLVADFVAEGYEHEILVTMVHDRAEIGPAAHEVQTVSFDTLRPAIIEDWRDTLPDSSDEELAQLADRAVLSTRGADPTLLAVYAGGNIAAHVALYFDRVGGIVQFENLVTHEAFRQRGYGHALVRAALHRSRDAGRDISFLTADLNDWPSEWYRRLGYVDVGRTHHFSRRD